MKQTIYIDVLMSVNLFVNYFILLGSSKFLGIEIKKLRLVLASVIGAIFSLYILLPTVNKFLSVIIEILMASLMIFVAFGFKDRVRFIKASVCFFSMNFSFAGLMFLLWKIFSPPGLILNNGIVYFNISPLLLIISTVASYIIIRLFNIITGKAKIRGEIYNVKIYKSERSCSILAKLDTGNSLLEPFSGLPVIVAEYDAIKEILLDDEARILTNKCELVGATSANGRISEGIDTQASLRLKLRFIPFNTVSEKGMLPSFKADKIEIKPVYVKQANEVDAYIAVCGKGYLYNGIQALLNPDLV